MSGILLVDCKGMLLDLLFPKTCVGCKKLGVYLCESCALDFPAASQICPMCGKGSIGGVTHAGCQRAYGMDGLIGIFSYKNGIKQAIKRLKYWFVQDMGTSFVEVAISRIDPGVLEFIMREDFLVSSVPLHPARERWRGFNQSRLLGELLAERFDLRFSELLERTKNTKSLAEFKIKLSRSELRELQERYVSLTKRRLVGQKLVADKVARIRAQEMRGAFEINSKLEINNSKLLLVGDVWTSGATMLECAKVLKRAGFEKVWGLTFARGGR
jgi:predicted amidophosphoribosyltransferase